MKREYRVLVVEDVATDAELIERQLKRDDIMFVSKRVDGKDEFIKELGDFAPDIVLSDYQLPYFDGLSALSILMQTTPDIPFIMISGAIGEEFAIEILKKGATDYILKDRMTRLGSAVERALHDAEKKRLQKQLEERTMTLQIENRELREREIKIRKIIRDVEELQDVLRMIDSKVPV